MVLVANSVQRLQIDQFSECCIRFMGAHVADDKNQIGEEFEGAVVEDDVAEESLEVANALLSARRADEAASSSSARNTASAEESLGRVPGRGIPFQQTRLQFERFERLEVRSRVSHLHPSSSALVIAQQITQLSLVTVRSPVGGGKSVHLIQAAERLRAQNAFCDGVFIFSLRFISDMPSLTLCIALACEVSPEPTDAFIRHLLSRNALLVFDDVDAFVDLNGAALLRLVAELSTSPSLHIALGSTRLFGVQGETAVTLPPRETPGADTRMGGQLKRLFEYTRGNRRCWAIAQELGIRRGVEAIERTIKVRFRTDLRDQVDDAAVLRLWLSMALGHLEEKHPPAIKVLYLLQLAPAGITRSDLLDVLMDVGLTAKEAEALILLVVELQLVSVHVVSWTLEGRLVDGADLFSTSPMVDELLSGYVGAVDNVWLSALSYRVLVTARSILRGIEQSRDPLALSSFFMRERSINALVASPRLKLFLQTIMAAAALAKIYVAVSKSKIALSIISTALQQVDHVQISHVPLSRRNDGPANVPTPTPFAKALKGRLLRFRGELRASCGYLRAAKEDVTLGSGLCASAGDIIGHSDAVWSLADFALATRDGEAKELTERAVSLYDAALCTEGSVVARLLRAEMMAGLGHVDKAETELKWVRDSFRSVKCNPRLADVLLTLTELYIGINRLADALDAVSEAADALRSSGDSHRLSRAMRLRGEVLILTDVFDEGVEEVNGAIELAEACGCEYEHGEGLRVKGEALLSDGRVADAWELLVLAVPLLKKCRNSTGVVNALKALARVKATMKQPAEALRLLNEALEVCLLDRHELARAVVLSAMAELKERMGDPEGAARAREEGADVLKLVGARLLEADRRHNSHAKAMKSLQAKR